MRLVREGLELWRTGTSAWLPIANACPHGPNRLRHSLCVLPNLYHLEGVNTPRERYTSGTLRIGAFGATRALKNLMTAAGAALQIANARRADLEFWISSGRNEGAGAVVETVRQMMTGLPHVKLVENGWQTWPQFRQTVRHMHLLLQPSYTESFNVVTADAIAEGVPSVVSDAIDWAPARWKAPVDDAGAIAEVGLQLLKSRRAPALGLRALKAHNRKALASWNDFLNS